MSDSLLDAPVPADQGEFWDALDREADRSEPEIALRLIDRQRELPEKWADQTARQAHYGREIFYFARAYGSVEGDFDEALKRATDGVETATTPVEQRTAIANVCQLLLAAHDLDREESTMPLIGSLAVIDPDDDLVGPRIEALVHLIALTLQGAGVNQINAGNPDAALIFYRSATDDFRQLGLTGQAESMMDRIAGLLRQGATDVEPMVEWLTTVAPETGPEAVRAVAEAALTAAARNEAGPDTAVRLFQLAQEPRTPPLGIDEIRGRLAPGTALLLLHTGVDSVTWSLLIAGEMFRAAVGAQPAVLVDAYRPHLEAAGTDHLVVVGDEEIQITGEWSVSYRPDVASVGGQSR